MRLVNSSEVDKPRAVMQSEVRKRKNISYINTYIWILEK